MTNNNTYLHSFTSILPAKVYPQNALAEWVVAAHERYETLNGRTVDPKRLKRFTVKETQISQRYSECFDVDSDWDNSEIYQLTKDTPAGLNIEKKFSFFSNRAIQRIEECYRENSIPDHLIHVTCTGYVAPSAPQVYFSNKQKAPGITHAYHMGCYASLPALKIAKAIALDGKKNVDIIHNEMCSLHLNLNDHSPEQMVVQTLFGDGHIHYRINNQEKGFKIIGIKEKVIPNTTQDMSWIPSPYGMSMTLSREVPKKISDHILPFVMEMIKEHGLDLAHIIKNGIFAIHPGGPRIIEVVKIKLELKDEQISESRKILFERGNMSSATLPHVWDEILKNNYETGTHVISLVFGPGLTVFGSIFEVV